MKQHRDAEHARDANSPAIQSSGAEQQARDGARARRVTAPPRCGSRARDGLDERRAELPPKPRDEHLDGVRVAVGVLRVDVLRELGLRHDAAAVVHQVRQHAELVAGELAPARRRRVTFALRGSSDDARRIAARRAACPLARRISARSRASTSSIRNGLAT